MMPTREEVKRVKAAVLELAAGKRNSLVIAFAVAAKAGLSLADTYDCLRYLSRLKRKFVEPSQAGWVYL